MIYDDESQRNSTTVTSGASDGVECEIRQISPDTSQINERARVSREKSRKRDVSFLESNLASRLDPDDYIKVLAIAHGLFRAEEKETHLYVIRTQKE